jgi:hypothetical protein
MSIAQRHIGRLALAALVLSAAPLYAQDQATYCAFEVSVRSPDGAPVAGIEVSERQSGAAVYSSATTNEHGTAMICDAPQGLVDLHVGGELCGAVTVGRLQPYWMVTRRVDITYKNCQGDDFFVPGGCLLTVRVRDQVGSPLEGVGVGESGEAQKKRQQTQISDRFGRIFRFLEYGEVASIELQKPGYVRQSITAGCQSGRSFVLYRTVTMEKRP